MICPKFHKLSLTHRILVFILYLLIIQTARFRIYYVSFHTPLPIMLLQATIHLSSPQMNRVTQTLCLLNDQSSQITYPRNTNTTFDPQNSLTIKNPWLLLLTPCLESKINNHHQIIESEFSPTRMT